MGSLVVAWIVGFGSASLGFVRGALGLEVGLGQPEGKGNAGCINHRSSHSSPLTINQYLSSSFCYESISMADLIHPVPSVIGSYTVH